MTSRIPLRPILGAAVCVLAVAAPLRSQVEAPARNRPLVGLIDRFLARPFDEDLRVGLLDSANVRPDVMVSISASVTPFLCYTDTASVIRGLDALLLTAFVSGNMRQQLVSGRSADQPEAGLRAVLTVYDTIRTRVANYRVPEVDAWRQALAAGRLAAVADSLRQHADEDCPHRTARYSPNAALSPVRP